MHREIETTVKRIPFNLNLIRVASTLENHHRAQKEEEREGMLQEGRRWGTQTEETKEKFDYIPILMQMRTVVHISADC